MSSSQQQNNNNNNTSETKTTATLTSDVAYRGAVKGPSTAANNNSTSSLDILHAKVAEQSKQLDSTQLGLLSNFTGSIGKLQLSEATSFFDPSSTLSSSSNDFSFSSLSNNNNNNNNKLGAISFNDLGFGSASFDNPVPDMPSYVEKYTSFTSTAFPQDILSTLSQTLSAISNNNSIAVELAVIEQEYRMEGTVCQSHLAANFRVNIFKKSTPGEYLIEFQRMSGDVVVFNSLFRNVKVAVSSSLLAGQSSSSASTNENQSFGTFEILPPFAFPVPVDLTFAPLPFPSELNASSSSPAPSSPSSAAAVSIAQDPIVPLMSMVSSPYVDVCSEGLKAVASLSSSSSNNMAALAEYLPTFVKILTANRVNGNLIVDDDVLRYVCFILLNLSKDASICNKLKELVNATQRGVIAGLVKELQASEQTCHRATLNLLNQLIGNISA